MAIVRTFRAYRPRREICERVAALPYDVYNRAEAKEEVLREPMSFLKVDRAETSFDESVDTYDDRVYQRAAELLHGMMSDGTYQQEDRPVYYIYELIMKDRHQTGLVACASIDGYLHSVIRKHENTRADKEQDRIRHVEACGAQTGPIFLAYRSIQVIDEIVDRVKKGEKLYGFTTPDGITHNVWVIDQEQDVSAIAQAFSKVSEIYIADGHHRAASAVKAGLHMRERHPGYTGEEEFNYFLSVLFPHDQLMILPYNRVVDDLNGYTKDEFLAKLDASFDRKESDVPVEPQQKGTFGMYLDDTWYELSVKPEFVPEDVVGRLDVSVLQEQVLSKLLGIEDPRTDSRIQFVGGIRGVSELERLVDGGKAVAFSMYPTAITELFDIADAGKLMPPKSTWFEPKLRSGIFIHKIDE